MFYSFYLQNTYLIYIWQLKRKNINTHTLCVSWHKRKNILLTHIVICLKKKLIAHKNKYNQNKLTCLNGSSTQRRLCVSVSVCVYVFIVCCWKTRRLSIKIFLLKVLYLTHFATYKPMNCGYDSILNIAGWPMICYLKRFM
jgi:hypothetical protein